ncbi:MAG: tetratricopeptide repeat protein [Flavobacteriales bacterium]|nr:tetratricopeptide repeat protein [Flavobacteriales bacterium]MDG2245023.1 tetratricopeptide repeat protein [Flavobacteriales bacterium]
MSLTSSFQLWSQSIDELKLAYAEERFEWVVEQTSEATTAEEFLLHADAHHKLGQFEQAMEAYQLAEQKGMNSFDFFMNRGICAFSLGQFEQMRNDLLEAKSIREDARIPYYFGAMAYLEEQHKQAANYLKDAIDLDPTYMEAHYLLGAVYLEQNKNLSAELAFIKCIELRPDFHQSKINLALAYIEQFKFQEALEVLERIIESAEKTALADAYYQQGVCRYQMHDSVGACESWTQAAALGDEDATKHVATICEGKQRKLRRRKTVHMEF